MENLNEFVNSPEKNKFESVGKNSRNQRDIKRKKPEETRTNSFRKPSQNDLKILELN